MTSGFPALIRNFFFASLLAASPILSFAAPPLVFCYEDADVRPWRTARGEGLNFELLDLVAREAKQSFAYVARPWKRCLAELKNNTVDGAIGASWKADRVEFGVYPGDTKVDPGKSLYSEKYIVLRRKGSAVGWDGKAFTQLNGPVGIQLGYSAADNLKALNVAVDDGARGARELFGKLAAGHINLAVSLAGEAQATLADNDKFRDKLEILPIPLVEKPYYLMLSKGVVSARPELAETIWSGIAKARKNPGYLAKEQSVSVAKSRRK